MRERPILFSAPMVRAILSGRKSQTRRIVKPQPAIHTSSVEWNSSDQAFVPWDNRCSHSGVSYQRNGHSIKCPYGAPGDRLWVRENFRTIQTGVSSKRVQFAADQACAEPHYDDKKESWPKWKPSIHMPRSACRIELEVTGVRVERIQSINEADAKAEGALCPNCDGRGWYLARFSDNHGTACPDCIAAAREVGIDVLPGQYVKSDAIAHFRSLWFKINGEKSWDANPWVWVIKFQRSEK